MATARRNEALGRKLKRLLQERDISRAAFAARAQITPNQLSRLLSGQRRFALPALEASARALNMTPEQLARGTKEEALLARGEARGRRRPARGAAAGRAAATSAAAAKARASRARAPRADERAEALQHSRAELSSLEASNRELTQRLAALESQLQRSEKQMQMLRARAEGAEQRLARMTARGTRLAGHRSGKRRAFGAALFAGLLGLGLRAVRRAA